MATLYDDLFELTTTGTLAIGGTSLTEAAFADLLAVTGSDIIKLVFNPDLFQSGAAEIVYVTAHTAASTTVTLLRAQEGTTAREWLSGTRVAAVVTAADYDDFRNRITAIETGASYRYGGDVYRTASGTFVKADYPGLRAVQVHVLGGGGAGGGAQATAAGEASMGTGGGAGGYSKKFILASALSASETVTVGAAGAAVVGAAGGNGGDSVFGVHATTTGGVGGGLAVAANSVFTVGTNWGAAGTGASGDLNISGQAGHSSSRVGASCQSGAGGDSALAPGGNARGVNSVGEAGTVGRLGAGGSGAVNSASQSARLGGDGGPGIVIVELYY